MKRIDPRSIEYFRRMKFGRSYLTRISQSEKYSEIRKFDPEYSFRKSLGTGKFGKCEFCGKETRLIPSNVFITIEKSDPIIYLCKRCRKNFFIRKKIEDDYRARFYTRSLRDESKFWKYDFKLFRWMMISGIEEGPINIISEILKLRVFYINLRFVKTKLDEFKIFYEMIHESNPINKKIEWMIKAFREASNGVL